MSRRITRKKMLRRMLRPDCVGWAFSVITTCALTWTLYNLHTLPSCRNGLHPYTDVKPHLEDPSIIVDDSPARALHQRMRVLCWIPSTEARLGSAVSAVNVTWARRCDGRVYFADTKQNVSSDVVSLRAADGPMRGGAALQHLYYRYLRHYDWFLKVEDDTYVIVENLKILLAQYNSSSPVHLGHRYVGASRTGGASYVISQEALRRVYEDGYRKDKCSAKSRSEDAEVLRCLHSVGVLFYDSRDRFGRDTFHPLRPRVDHMPEKDTDRKTLAGRMNSNCCSQLTVSFHSLAPELMRVFDHLLYRTSVYGRLQDLRGLGAIVSLGETSAP